MDERAAALAVIASAPLLAGCLSGDDTSGGIRDVAAWEVEFPVSGTVTLDVSEDGDTVAMAVLQGGQKKGTLYVLDAETGCKRFDFSYLYGFCCAFPPVALDADGDRVFAGGNTLYIMDANSGEVLSSYDLPRDGENFPEVPVTVDISPDGKLGVAPTWEANRLVALRADASAPTWEEEFGDGEEFADARISGDGSTIAVATPYIASLRSASSGGSFHAYAFGDDATGFLPSVAIDQDGSHYATTAFVGDQLWVYYFARDEDEPVWSRPLAKNEYWGGVFVTPDASLVAAWSPGQSFVFDENGQVVTRLPDGSRILSFVPVTGGALLLLDAKTELQVLHVAKGFRFEHGSFGVPEGFLAAALTPYGVVVAESVEVPDGGLLPDGSGWGSKQEPAKRNIRLSLLPVPDLPSPGVTLAGD